MKYFILCSIDQPQDGEWCELAEFKLSESKEEIEREFKAAVIDGEYPFVITGVVQTEANARMEVTEY